MASKLNFTLDQGSVFDVSFPIKDPASNTSANLSSYTGSSQFRRHYTSSKAYTFEVTIANSSVYLHMDSNLSENIVPGRYMYDVELKDSSNQVYRVAEGIITVSPNITRV